MKTSLLLVLLAVLICKTSFGDIIMPHTHYVAKCIRITNLEDYPEVSFIGYSYFGDKNLGARMLSSEECLGKANKVCWFTVYAVNKSYLTGKDISEIKFPEDPHAFASSIDIRPVKGYLPDSIPISGIEEYYKVVGFMDSKVILYKWKQVTKYNNGKPELTETFTYDGDLTILSQKITEGNNTSRIQPRIEVYPDPTHKSLHLQIYDSYKGTVPVELVTASGKVLKSFSKFKQDFLFDSNISLAGVEKGDYLLKVQMGKTVEYRKVLYN